MNNHQLLNLQFELKLLMLSIIIVFKIVSRIILIFLVNQPDSIKSYGKNNVDF